MRLSSLGEIDEVAVQVATAARDGEEATTEYGSTSPR